MSIVQWRTQRRRKNTWRSIDSLLVTPLCWPETACQAGVPWRVVIYRHAELWRQARPRPYASSRSIAISRHV